MPQSIGGQVMTPNRRHEKALINEMEFYYGFDVHFFTRPVRSWVFVPSFIWPLAFPTISRPRFNLPVQIGLNGLEDFVSVCRPAYWPNQKICRRG